MTTFNPKSLPTSKLHSYLLSTIAPRPIAFASTIDAQGNPNLSPFSFFNVFSANPPILIFSPARRVRNNTEKDTLHNAIATKEVVINVVNFDLVHQMSLSSTEYDKGDNEFKKAGLTMLKSDVVQPFRVAESPVQFECKINNVVKLGDQGGAGNLIICEVVRIHIDAAVLNEDETVNQEKLDLVARAGGSYYSRAKQGFFEIPKPVSGKGIGVDNFSENIKKSTVLTGNDFGMLGNIEALPTQEVVSRFIADLRTHNPNVKIATDLEKHKLAKDYLSSGDVASAWKILLSESINN